MKSNGWGKNAPAESSAFEFCVLHALKGRLNATSDEIRRNLPWPSEAIAVRIALLRLEERVLVTHIIANGQILYHCLARPDLPDVATTESSDLRPGQHGPL
jgi:hypothetical protein